MTLKLSVIGMILVVLLAALAGSAGPGRAQAGDPYSLIDAVNSLRAANGLPAYQENNILMSIAQAQTDYQAAIGECTHTGAGGTRPTQRALYAGYGGGASFRISENYMCGTNLSVDEAISSWLQDAPHTQTMLGGGYQDVGAGVSVSGDYVYYTLDVAYVAGSGNYIAPATRTPGGPTAIPIYVVQTATPNPDGSIIHVVRSGQTLIGIATAYGLKLQQLLDLNHLESNDIIYEGEKLVIRNASTPGPTATLTSTSTPTRAATPTHKPTRTPTPSVTPTTPPTAAVLAEAVAENSAGSLTDRLGTGLVIAIIIMMAGGVILMLVGSLLKRRKIPPAD